MPLSFPSSEFWTALSSLVLLYPEIHYVFKYFPFSRYRRKEPEIIADAPRRIEPGHNLPVLLLVKDSDQYPIIIESVKIIWSAGSFSNSKLVTLNEAVQVGWWYRIFTLDLDKSWYGCEVSVNVEIDYVIRGKKKKALNDNLPGLSHACLKVNAAKEKLPSIEGWIHGDLHFHTNYTNDQVEFGAPLAVSVEMARAMGLQFLAATDHSYDLDDMESNFLINDPEQKKWKKFQHDVRGLNLSNPLAPVIIPGEEVSCANAEGRNVHCLVLNNAEYLPGSGDSAEKLLQTDAELSIRNIVEQADPAAWIAAAHPKDPVPLLEKLLLRRGTWNDEDCRTDGLSGLQVLNGPDNEAFGEGLTQWRRQLLRGERVFIYAGNDSHGNFNRYRQVKTLMWSLYEIYDHQCFGIARTAVHLRDDKADVGNLVSHLKQGRAVITNGPIAAMSITNESGIVYGIGEEAHGSGLTCRIECRSSEEMGELSEILIWAGIVGDKEYLFRKIHGNGFLNTHELALGLNSFSYLRCEVRTVRKLFCYTNPIWIVRNHDGF